MVRTRTPSLFSGRGKGKQASAGPSSLDLAATVHWIDQLSNQLTTAGLIHWPRPTPGSEIFRQRDIDKTESRPFSWKGAHRQCRLD